VISIATLALTLFSLSFLYYSEKKINMGNCNTTAGKNTGHLCDLTFPNKWFTSTVCCTLKYCKTCPPSYPSICLEYPDYSCSKLQTSSDCSCQLLNPVGRSLLSTDADPIEEFVKTAPDFDKYDDRKSS